MLKIYFGEWGNGRLKRLPYLGYYVLLMFLLMVVIFGMIFAVGASERLMGGDLLATQQLLTERFGILAIVGFVVLMIIALFAQVNILAKRIRDMGLPALWTILGILAVSLLLNMLFPAQEVAVSTTVVQTAEGTAASISANSTAPSMIVQSFDMIVFLCLLLIPSDTFNKK
jgi:uncharacterized membrane protein YhaH (DUF805 family)